MSPTTYNNNYRITQSPELVAIEIKVLGGIIPTDGVHLNLDAPPDEQLVGAGGGPAGHGPRHFDDRAASRRGDIALVERFRRVGKVSWSIAS